MRTDVETDGPADTLGAVDTAVDERPKTDIRLILSEKMVKLTEGATALTGTFTVTLSQTSPHPFIVTVLTGNPNVATVGPETLEFAANEIGPKEVTVIPTTDDDTVDSATVVTLSSPETGSASVTVDVKDSDMQTLIVPAAVAMTEGRSEPFGVRLFKRPASSVVVTLTSSNPSKLSVGTTTMTFNAQNYSIPQTATLTAAQDDDTTLDHVTVNLTATGNVSAVSVAVEITDDDAVNMDISPATLTLMERGPNPGTIMVRLTRPPSADVTVAVASSNGMKATVSPGTLVFTPANYATAQSVQVSPVPDDDSRDEMLNVTFSATGVSPAPPTRTVAVLVDDPDNQALQVIPNTVSVKEGETTTFDVRLTLNPGASSTVAVFSQNPAKVEVSPPVLTFTTGNFSTPQTVTVKSINDDDLANDSVMVTLTGSSADNVNVPVAVTDDDMQKIQLIGPSPGSDLVMQETRLNGPPSTSQVGVRLAFRPPTPVTVLLTSGNGSKLELSRSTLTFTPSDYASVQFVNVTAPHDNDMVDDVIELSATATSPGAGIPLAKLSVEIRDMDVLAFDVSKSSLGTLVEAGTPSKNVTEGFAEFTVKLTVVPETPVTAKIDVVPAEARDQKVTVTVTPDPCVLMGATALSPGCTVRVTAHEDFDAKDEALTVRVSDAAGKLTAWNVAVAIDDQDTQGLSVTKPNTAELPPDNPILVTEGAPTDEVLLVHLTAQPTSDVTVNLSTSPADQVSFTSTCPLSGSSLVFNATNWLSGCKVRIVGTQDDDLLLTNLSLRLNAVGLGVSDVFVNVRKSDDDTQKLVLTEPIGGPLGTCGIDYLSSETGLDISSISPISLAEEPASASPPNARAYCVHLRYLPEVPNTVTFTPTQLPLPLGSASPNFTVDPPMMMFSNVAGSPTIYNHSQRVLIKALSDDQNLDTETNGMLTVSITPFATPTILNVFVQDNDGPQRIVLTELTKSMTVADGETLPTLVERKQELRADAASVGVNLSYVPVNGETEVLTIAPTKNGGKVSLNGTMCGSGAPTTMAFTTATWSTAQTLRIEPCMDDDVSDVDVELTVSSNHAPATAPRTFKVFIDDMDVLRELTVHTNGSGRVDSNPAGILACRRSGTSMSGDCTESYVPNTLVSLTATPDDSDEWRFGAWTEDCNNSGMVLMSDARSCTATFNPRLRVIIAGQGSVTSMALSAPCTNATCEAFPAYQETSAVDLTSSAALGWVFDAWAGPGCTTTTATPFTASVVMSAPRTCAASFVPSLRVEVDGTGSGHVDSTVNDNDDDGIDNCRANTSTADRCNEPYPVGTVVKLTAQSDSSSTFGGWSAGCGTTSGSTATITISAGTKHLCQATFSHN